jgi:prepilin-type N-terminal cleavage/methylation domain-containing protein
VRLNSSQRNVGRAILPAAAFQAASVNTHETGVTLIEMLIVVAIAGVMAVIALPSFSNGLDNLRLSQASDSVAAFLNGALNRSERRQQVVEVSISPRENTILLRSADDTFARTLAMPDGVTVEGEPRRILLLPGSVPPRFGIQLVNRRGMRRVINVDPITGVPQIDRIAAAP